ncbi:hypothetical protein EY643_14390 [Halioglobus maricola]|uniref:Two component regulator three Y domain-containing protein n=1 Tax=Halioglobus maricola TaxID=2601894 RepID=A0A5P9NLT6_9GAMM|nr:triple tyrosine motif-containing protein [Halioglobus maricola]QFU76747.1 hypothetical protein EY643_14390 [Halioglobus maricola]
MPRQKQNPIVLIVALCLFATPVFASTGYQIVTPQFVKQIAQPTITSLMQDSLENLWIGTQEGLYRFNGTTLSSYREGISKSGPIHFSDIRGIVESQNGQILVAAYGIGIVSISQKSSQATLAFEDQDISLNSVTGISKGPNGTIWITTRSDVFRLQANQRISKIELGMTEPKESAELLYITHTRNGDTYLGGSFGLAKYSRKTNSFRIDTSLIRDEHIVALGEGPENSIIAATQSGQIYQIPSNSATSPSSKILDVEQGLHISKLATNKERFYIATNRGIYIYSSNFSLFSVIRSKDSALGNDAIMSLLFVGEDIWIGTFQGLFAATEREVELYNKSNAEIHDEVLSFTQDAEDYLWIGTYNGLYRANFKGEQHYPFGRIYQSKLTDHRVMSLASDKDKLWIGYQEHGVDLVDLSTGKVTRPLPEGTENFAVTAILPTESNTVWIATYNLGLYRLSGQVLKRFRSLGEPSVTVIAQTSSGSIYTVTEKNLYRHNASTDEFQRVDLEFDSLEETPRILSFAEHPNGAIFLGTKDHGLFELNGEFQHLTGPVKAIAVSKLSMSNTIYSIEIDSTGQIWTATEEGIRVFSANKKPLRHLLVRDGLQGNDFNFGASLVDREGNLLFGGVNGYNKITPNKVSTDMVPPVLRITNIRTLSDNIQTNFENSNGRAYLDYTDEFIMFQFSVLDYIAHDSYKYRYRLIGFKDEWIYSGFEHSATYTNLPAGLYRFEVQSTNLSGAWTNNPTKVDLIVNQSPWLTPWAHGLYLFAFLLSIFALKKFYDAIIVREKALSYGREMAATADTIETELNELFDSHQDDLKTVRVFYAERLRLLQHVFSNQKGKQRDDIHELLSAFELLDRYCARQPLNQGIELCSFTELVIAQNISAQSIEPSLLISINRVPEQSISLERSLHIAISIFEMVRINLSEIKNEKKTVRYFEIELTFEPRKRREVVIRINTSLSPKPANELIQDDPALVLNSISEITGGRLEIISKENSLNMETNMTFGIPPQI